MPTYPEYRQFIDQKSASAKPAHFAGGRLLPTAPDITGPFYKPGAPFRDHLADPATLYLFGSVLNLAGAPVVGAVLDFWQADEVGKYDNDGYDLRGKVRSNQTGNYELFTVRPNNYDISDPGDPQPHEFRCAHVHVKIEADGFTPLTTQLYFADDPYNNTDHWFSRDRVVDPKGYFCFVLTPKG